MAIYTLTGCINDDDDSALPAAIINVGDSVPVFTLVTADGGQLTSAALKGRGYLLNFFDTQCSDCRQLLPQLQRIYNQYGGRCPVINVPRSQSASQVEQYWQEAGLTMPYYIPADKQLYYKFATYGVPRTYAVDGEGKVVASFGDSPVPDYDALQAALLGVMGAQTTRADSVTVSLKVRVPRMAGADDPYFYNEYAISHLDLYFFDSQTKQLAAKTFVNNLTKATDVPDTKYDITYIYESIRLRAGVYDIFAIANYDNAPQDVVDELEFLNVIDDITYSSGIEANMPDKGPVMTNTATSLLAVNLEEWAYMTYTLNIEMERVMAKLQLGIAQNIFRLDHNSRRYADINITNYKLVNLNRQYYLFQHTDQLEELTAQPQFSQPQYFADYTDQGNRYVVDPLFYDKRADVASAALVGQYYESWYGAFSTDNFASMPAAGNYGYAYVLENTAFRQSQKNSYLPGIVFKAAVNPVFVYLYNQATHSLQEEYRPEYWPPTIYLYNYYFYGTLQALNEAANLGLDQLRTYTDEELKAYGIKQCKFNMGVYETYYTYWIRHRNSPDDPMGPMQYGVVRNNFYKLVVTGVSGIGSSSIAPDLLRDNYPNSYVDVVSPY